MSFRWRTLMAVLAAAAMSACGGGGGGSSCAPNVSVGGGSATCSSGTTNSSYTLTLLADSSQLLSDGKSTVTLTARVKDSSTNAAVSGQTVNFSTDSGTLSTGSGSTDSTGSVQVVLDSNDDRSNRVITVTAKSGSNTKTATVQVLGTTLAFGGSVSAIAGRSSTMSVTLKDGGNAPLVGQIQLSSSSTGSTLTPSVVTTNSAGLANFTYTPSGGSSDTLTARALGATATLAITVSSVDLSITSPAAGTNVEVNTGCQQVRATLSGDLGPVSFTINRGLLYANSSCTSGTGLSTTSVLLNGTTADVWVRSTNVGSASVLAKAGGGAASLGLNFISTNPYSITVQGNPSSVAVSQASSITAIVRDLSGNVVANQDVNFSAPNGGGQVIPQTARTDNSGVATTTFTADPVSSGNHQVQIHAEVANKTSIASDAYLTVGGQAIRIGIGSDNLVYELTDLLQYQQRFVVKVTDTNGSPVANQTVSISVAEVQYAKGYWTTEGAVSPYKWRNDNATSAVCQSEDRNYNGILDAGDVDLNGDGYIQPDGMTTVLRANTSSGSSVMTATTDANGEAYVWLNYPMDHAGWVQYRLTVSAMVGGTNNQSSRTNWLIVPIAPLQQDAAPPFVKSPFGTDLNLGCYSPY